MLRWTLLAATAPLRICSKYPFEMPIALFLSPHLDDVAFSCGGTLLRLTDDPDWRVVLCTVFTASVSDPQGFALRCQTDKGIHADLDYMALRRTEDEAYAKFAGVEAARRWNYREAPHRGYESPADLFAGPHDDDAVWQALSDDLSALDDELRPDVIFAPQGLGNHVDHLQTIRAALAVWPVERVLWYRDTPYAIREPDALPAGLLRLEEDLFPCQVPVSSAVLDRKIAGCSLYVSQIGFQFGGPVGVREKLTAFHQREAQGQPSPVTYAETFLGHPCVVSALPR